jgi:predicted AlkP superfamily pyrophosphatase or phosphodiesterase
MAYLRKLTALLLCISMIFCLFSCGKEEEQTDPDVTEDENGGEQTDGGEEEFNPYPYEDLSVFMDLPNYKSVTISQAVLDQMVNNKEQNGTKLLNICLDIPRNIAEKYGTDSVEYEDMLYRLDGAIENFLKVIDICYPKQQDYLIVLTSDHGMGGWRNRRLRNRPMDRSLCSLQR